MKIGTGRNHSVTSGPEPVLLGPGVSGGTRRKHRPGGSETRRKHRFSEMGGGRPWPPPSPRRSQRLMITSGPAGPPGQGASCPLRRSSTHSDWSPVTEGLRLADNLRCGRLRRVIPLPVFSAGEIIIRKIPLKLCASPECRKEGCRCRGVRHGREFGP